MGSNKNALVAKNYLILTYEKEMIPVSKAGISYVKG
jgi:hypothetical protein